MSETRESLFRALTPTFLIVLIVIALFSLIVGMVTDDMSGSYNGVLEGWFLPFIYIVVLMEVLGRYSKRLRLNPAQYLLLMIPLWFAAGKAYITDGTLGWESPFDWMQASSFGAFSVGALAAPYSSSWIPVLEMLPSYVIPHSVAAASIEWNGLAAGQSIPWGAYLGPMAFWSLFLIAAAFINLSLSFTITGPEWTETERLIYPLMVPPIYLIQTATTRDEAGHSSILSFRTAKMKMFWIMALVGLLIGGVPVILSFIPAFSYLAAYEWGEIPLTWGSYIAGIMPGAYISPTFIILQAILMILLPYEVMVTSLVTWLLIPMFYDTLAVKMGWVTYVAGSENNGAWLYGEENPFPYQLWAAMGLTLGIGLYFAWRMRGRIKKALGTIFGPTYYEGDFSVKTGSLMLLGSTILFYILVLAMGVNWLIGIIWLIFYFIWAIAETRMMAEVWWHPPIMMYTYWQLYWPIGAGLGIWSTAPAQNNASLMATNVLNVSMGDWWAARLNPLGPGYLMGLYKVGHDVKASIKDIFNWTTILTVITFPVTAVFMVWFFAHVGMVNTAISGDAVWRAGNAFTAGITSSTNSWYAGDSFTGIWGWTIGGIVLIFVLMWIRSIAPWFMFNPVAFVLTLWLPEYMWLASLFALVFKYIFSKTLGPRRTEEYIVPAATGFAVGYGLLYVVVGIYVWATYSWPLLMTSWHPRKYTRFFFFLEVSPQLSPSWSLVFDTIISPCVR